MVETRSFLFEVRSTSIQISLSRRSCPFAVPACTECTLFAAPLFVYTARWRPQLDLETLELQGSVHTSSPAFWQRPPHLPLPESSVDVRRLGILVSRAVSTSPPTGDRLSLAGRVIQFLEPRPFLPSLELSAFCFVNFCRHWLLFVHRRSRLLLVQDSKSHDDTPDSPCSLAIVEHTMGMFAVYAPFQ